MAYKLNRRNSEFVVFSLSDEDEQRESLIRQMKGLIRDTYIYASIFRVSPPLNSLNISFRRMCNRNSETDKGFDMYVSYSRVLWIFFISQPFLFLIRF